MTQRDSVIARKSLIFVAIHNQAKIGFNKSLMARLYIVGLLH
ncbi:hypothetical protein [Helicobacter rodentium]|nr:hypothetical protein [Helicobacter rodentium]